MISCRLGGAAEDRHAVVSRPEVDVEVDAAGESGGVVALVVEDLVIAGAGIWERVVRWCCGAMGQLSCWAGGASARPGARAPTKRDSKPPALELGVPHGRGSARSPGGGPRAADHRIDIDPRSPAGRQVHHGERLVPDESARPDDAAMHLDRGSGVDGGDHDPVDEDLRLAPVRGSLHDQPHHVRRPDGDVLGMASRSAHPRRPSSGPFRRTSRRSRSWPRSRRS